MTWIMKDLRHSPLGLAFLWCILLISHTTAAFEQAICFQRDLQHLTPSRAYNRCLCGWREDNLGLWLPPPVILDSGDPETGVGLTLLRLPPGLQERIIGFDEQASKSDDLKNEDSLAMRYTLVNPGPLTWPVSKHMGVISFDSLEVGCSMTWTVRWTPLLQHPRWLAHPASALLKAITSAIISCAVKYVVAADVPGQP